MNLTNDDVLKIIEIIAESGYDRVCVETADLKLHVQREGPPTAGQPRSTEQMVQATILGTFLRTAPGERKPFVEIGDKIGCSDIVGIIRTLSRSDTIKAGIDGTVVRILVEDGALVEYWQPLMVIECSPHAPERAP